MEEAFDAVDLLLERGGDVVDQGLGRGAGVARDDGDGRRGDLRVLRKRQVQQREAADQDDDEREDGREDRPGG
jgi:hypothetical protein